LPPLAAVLEKGRDVEGPFSDDASLRVGKSVRRGRRGVEDIESFWNCAVKLEIVRGFIVAGGSPFKTSFEESLRSSKCLEKQYYGDP
jgi:hypothetical protein